MLAKQNTLKGISLYALAALFVVCMGAFGKAMGDAGHHPLEVVFYRALGGLIIMSIYICAFKKFDDLKTTKHKAHLSRSLVGSLAILLFFWAVSLLPLSTVTAILYLSPVLVTVMSALILKEQVGKFRWLAVAIGFLGTLFLIQPTGEAYSLLGITVALLNTVATAGVSILLRDLGSSEKTTTTIFYLFLYGTIATGLFMPFIWTGLPEIWWLVLGLVVTGFINQPLKTQAFRIADASAISPVQYFNIIWATLIGYMVWHNVPTPNIVIGCLIVITSNAIIIWREKILKTRVKTATSTKVL